MTKISKRALSLVATLALCACMFTGVLSTWAAPGDPASEWKVDTTTGNGWTFEDDAMSAVPGANGLDLVKAKQDGWPQAILMLDTPVVLDMTTNKYLRFDIESNCAFNLVIHYGDGESYKVGSRLINGGSEHGDIGAGRYTNDGVSLLGLIERYGATDMKIRGISFYIIGGTADGSDCRVTLREFGIVTHEGTANKALSLTNTTDWEALWGGDIRPVAQDGSLLLSFGGNGSEATMQTAQMGSVAHPLVLNLNKDTVLDLDITAHNGFNVTAMIRNPQTGKTLGINLNCFITNRNGGEYKYDTYGDRVEAQELVIKEKISVRAMLEKAIELQPKDAYHNADFTIPADGVVEIYEFRTQVSYVPAGEGMIIRKLVFRQLGTDNTIKSAKIGDYNGVINQEAGMITFRMPETEITSALRPTFVLGDAKYATLTKPASEDLTGEKTVTYTVTSEKGVAKEYTVKIEKMSADANITSVKIGDVAGVVDAAQKTIQFRLNKTQFGDGQLELTFQLAAGATVVTTGKQDFTAGKSVNYELKAEDGSSTVYAVSVYVLSDKKEVVSATLNEIDGVVDNTAHTVTFTLPAGSQLGVLKPSFNVSDKASIDDETGKDFAANASQTYTVTAEDKTTQAYTVTVVVEKYNESKITGATLNGVTGVIDEAKHEVSFTLLPGTDVKALTPEFVVSTGATVLESGAKDFTNAQTYTVRAQNGTEQTYTVRVVIPDVQNFYQFDLGNTSFTHTEGDGALNFSDISWDDAKKALVLQAGNPGVWANVDGEIAPVYMDINKATHLHFDLKAGNGWNLVLFFKDMSGKLLIVDTNRFISQRDGMGEGLYYTGTYKDSLNLKDMILANNADYTLPENGLLQLTGVRFWVGYHGDKDASIEAKYIALDAADAANTVGKENAVEPNGVKDSYTANLKGPWAGTGEGDITIGSAQWDESKGAMVAQPNKAGNWTNVDYQFGYNEKLKLNLNKATYLHYNLVAGNGWDLVVFMRDADGNVLRLSANDFISKHYKGMEGIQYTGNYQEALPLNKMIAYAKECDPNNAFTVPSDGVVEVFGLRLWIGYHGDTDASIQLKMLAFDDQTASHTDGYSAVVYSEAPKAAWTPINSHWLPLKNGDMGIGFVGYDASKGGLSIVPNKAGEWTQIDYNFAYGETIKLNLNKASFLHYNLTAGNGWDFQMLLVDDKGETLPLSVNSYLSEMDGKGYRVAFYKGDYKDKVDLKSMIISAMRANPDSKFKMPANGVVTLKEFRIWLGYHGDKDNASMLVRKLNFNNEKGTNTDVNAPATGFDARAIAIGGALLLTSSAALVLSRKKKKAN